MKLSVALCTYNGEKFIAEQLESIARQTVLPDELIICDDRSADRTVQILHEFAHKAPFPVSIYHNETTLGVIRNFEQAISICNGEYIALADQDDVWLPEKIEKSLALIESAQAQYAGEEVPLLVHTDLKVVDKQLKVISESFMHAQKLHNEDSKQALKTLLVQNYVTGCTVIINRKLKELALPFPAGILMHDWWLALLAAAEGMIVFSAERTILYRQHGKNAVGAQKYFSRDNLRKVLAFRQMQEEIKQTIQQAAAFTRHKPAMRLRSRECIANYLANVHKQDYWALFRAGIHKQGFLRNLIFYIFFISLDKE